MQHICPVLATFAVSHKPPPKWQLPSNILNNKSRAAAAEGGQEISHPPQQQRATSCSVCSWADQGCAEITTLTTLNSQEPFLLRVSKKNRLGTIINKTFSIFCVLKVEIMQNHMLLSFLCKALKSREEERSCKCLMKSVLCIICEHTVFVLYLLWCFYFQPPCIKDEATKMCISEEIAGAVVRCAATLNIAKTCYSFPPFWAIIICHKPNAKFITYIYWVDYFRLKPEDSAWVSTWMGQNKGMKIKFTQRPTYPTNQSKK